QDAAEGGQLMAESHRLLRGQIAMHHGLIDLFEHLLDTSIREQLEGVQNQRGGLPAGDVFGQFRVEFGAHCSMSVTAFWSSRTSTASLPCARISSISRARRTC